jgi:hypothetical protein
MVTPFLTEFSYYGLIDEAFGLHFNRIYIEDHKVVIDKEKPDPNKPPCLESRKPENKFKVCKNMECVECPSRIWFDLATIFDVPPKEDSLSFAELKKYSLGQANKKIKEIMKVLMDMEKQNKNMGNSMDAIDFKLKFLDLKKYVQAHMSIAKNINENLNDPNMEFSLKLSQKIVGDYSDSLLDKILSMADAEEPLHTVISLAVLANFVKSGVKSSFMENLMNKVFDNYGYKGTQVLLKMRRAGLLFVRSSSNRDAVNSQDVGAFSVKKEELDLISDEDNPSQDVGAKDILIFRKACTTSTQDTFQCWQRTLKVCSTQSILKIYGILFHFINSVKVSV